LTASSSSLGASGAVAAARSITGMGVVIANPSLLCSYWHWLVG
jgi:hypothetical protein